MRLPVALVVLLASCDQLDLPQIVIDAEDGISVRTQDGPRFVETRARCEGLFDVQLTAIAVDPDGADDISAVSVLVEAGRDRFVDRFALDRLDGDREQFAGTLSLFDTEHDCNDALSVTFVALDRAGHETRETVTAGQ